MDEEEINRIVDARIAKKLKEEQKASTGKVARAAAVGAVLGGIGGVTESALFGPPGALAGAGAGATIGAIRGAVVGGVGELATGWWSELGGI